MNLKGNTQDVLLTPTFLAGLCLLLLNDFLLKPLFHNWITGKLSDFAGLLIFPLFCVAILPKWKRAIYLMTALGFIFWKSPYSEPVIESWNKLPLFDVGRTIDYSDLAALSLLPLTYFCTFHNYNKQIVTHRFARGMIIVASAFAFTATQMADEQRTPSLYDREYSFGVEKVRLLEQLMGDESLYVRRAAHLDTQDGEHYVLTIKRKFCKGAPSAYVEVIGRENKTVMKLLWIEYKCDEPQPEQELLKIFEDEVVKKLPVLTGPKVGQTSPPHNGMHPTAKSAALIRKTPCLIH